MLIKDRDIEALAVEGHHGALKGVEEFYQGQQLGGIVLVEVIPVSILESCKERLNPAGSMRKLPTVVSISRTQ
jgi:hypothetical protein